MTLKNDTRPTEVDDDLNAAWQAMSSYISLEKHSNYQQIFDHLLYDHKAGKRGWDLLEWFYRTMTTEHTLRDGLTILGTFRLRVERSFRWFAAGRGWGQNIMGLGCNALRIGLWKPRKLQYVWQHQGTDDERSKYLDDNERPVPHREAYREINQIRGLTDPDDMSPRLVLAIDEDVHHLVLSRKQAARLRDILDHFARTGALNANPAAENYEAE